MSVLSGKRVLVCIPNYGTEQLHLAERQVEEIDRWGVRGDVVFHTTHPIAPTNRNVPVTNIQVAEEIGPRIPWLHRPLMAERCNDYDLFIYSENDLLIEARHLTAFLECDAILPAGLLTGLVRYEFADGDASTRYLPDAHGDWPVFESAEIHGGELFFSIFNKFSSCFILTREQLQIALRSGGFLRERDFIEAVVIDVYEFCGLRKVLSFPRLESLLVHHLSNRYANETWGFWERKPLTVEALVALVHSLSGNSLAKSMRLGEARRLLQQLDQNLAHKA